MDMRGYDYDYLSNLCSAPLGNEVLVDEIGGRVIEDDRLTERK